MLLVLDVNVVISALINKGNSFKVFENNSVFHKLEFIAPEFILFEIENNFDKILSSTKLLKEEVDEILSFIKKQTEFISFLEFKDKLPEAML